MAQVEGIGQLIQSQVGPKLEPHVVEALRHGNIHEILRTHGINRRDIEDYLSGQWRLFQNQILQGYQVYADHGTVDAPVLDRFPVHSKEMFLDSGDHQFFHQDMQMFRMAKADAVAPQGPGQDVAEIGGKAVQDWQNFYSELQGRMIDAQMVSEMRSKTDALNRDTQRIIALVMSGQIDPEYVLIAAAKSNMLQNGTLFSWKGRRIMHLNEEMNNASKDLLKMDANDKGYMGALQMAQSKTRSGSTQMQMELMDLQKFSQNVATTLDWVSNAIRMFAQMRQTPTQAIAAR